jgi:hypothetical protein
MKIEELSQLYDFIIEKHNESKDAELPFELSYAQEKRLLALLAEEGGLVLSKHYHHNGRLIFEGRAKSYDVLQYPGSKDAFLNACRSAGFAS